MDAQNIFVSRISRVRMGGDAAQKAWAGGRSLRPAAGSDQVAFLCDNLSSKSTLLIGSKELRIGEKRNPPKYRGQG